MIDQISTFVLAHLKRTKGYYKEKPFLMGFATILPVFTMIAFAVVLMRVYDPYYGLFTDEKIQDRIVKLDTIQKSLLDVSKFISEMKSMISREGIVLKEIQSEHDSIEPLLTVEQKVVDSMFYVQNQKNKWNLWIGLAMGFFLGIGASFIGSIFYAMYMKNRNEKKKPHIDISSSADSN